MGHPSNTPLHSPYFSPDSAPWGRFSRLRHPSAPSDKFEAIYLLGWGHCPHPKYFYLEPPCVVTLNLLKVSSFKLHTSSQMRVSLQWRRQKFAPGGTGAWRTGSDVRGDRVIQKWNPSGVRSAKTNMAIVFCNNLPR